MRIYISNTKLHINKNTTWQLLPTIAMSHYANYTTALSVAVADDRVVLQIFSFIIFSETVIIILIHMYTYANNHECLDMLAIQDNYVSKTYFKL